MEDKCIAIYLKVNCFENYHLMMRAYKTTRIWKVSPGMVLEGPSMSHICWLAYDFKKLGPPDFWQIADSVLNKDKSAIPPLFNGPEVMSSAFDKAKLFA